ncbi:MAG: hypothetical protein VYE73_04515 [Acidobacteriota bacterium]|nr:hypothetical protein [Acidobacteriota bacterium]
MAQDDGSGLIFGLLLWTVAAPTVVVAAVLWLSGRLERSAWGAYVAWAAGYLVAHGGIAGVPAWPPLTSVQGLFYIVVLAAVVGLRSQLVGARAASRVRGALFEVALVVLLVWLTLRPMIQVHWTGREAAVSLSAVLALLAGVWLATRPVDGSAALDSLVWAGGFAGTSVGLGLSSTALLAQLAALCGLLTVAVAALGGSKARFSPPHRLWIVSLAALTAGGAYYADLGLWRAGLLFAAPAAGIVALRRLQGRPARLRVAGALLAVAFVQAPALASTAADFLERGSAYDYGY